MHFHSSIVYKSVEMIGAILFRYNLFHKMKRYVSSSQAHKLLNRLWRAAFLRFLTGPGVSTVLCCENSTLLVVSLGAWANEAVATSDERAILVSRALTKHVTQRAQCTDTEDKVKSQKYTQWPTKKTENNLAIDLRIYLSSEAASSSNGGSGEICVFSLSKTWMTGLNRVPLVASSTSRSLKAFGTKISDYL